MEQENETNQDATSDQFILWYVIIDEQSMNNLSGVKREDYVRLKKGQRIIYAGNKDEIMAFTDNYNGNAPYPVDWDWEYHSTTQLQEAMDKIAQLQSQLTTIHNRERQDYFAGCTTVVEIKTRYLRLADEYNFYRGGDAKTIKRINEEYAKACDPIIMRSATSEEDMFKQFNRAEGFVEVISLLLVLTGIKIEIVDAYLWVSTEDYQSGREIREINIRYSKSKQAWYYPL